MAGEIDEAKSTANGALGPLMKQKFAGLPWLVWFVLGVIILAWWIRKHQNTSGGVPPAGLFEVAGPMPYTGGPLNIHITNEIDNDKTKKHHKGGDGGGGKHHHHHKKFPHEPPPPHGKGPGGPPRWHGPPMKPPHIVNKRVHWPKKKPVDHRPDRTSAGVPLTPQGSFPGSELFTAGTPQVKRVTLSSKAA